MKHASLLLIPLLGLASCVEPRQAIAEVAGTAKADNKIWFDGMAEVSGYELIQPRYGQLRKGQAVLIYVSEPFSESARVKADPGRHPESDVYPVLKLNFVKDFQTGIYDYNLMTSIFTTFGPRHGRRVGTPTKITFSMQEWCGNVFEELIFGADSLRQERFSYFDGEGDTKKDIKYPQDAVSVDELFILVRGIPKNFLEPGSSREVPILPSLARLRMTHRPLKLTKGKLSRGKGTRNVKVPFGEFSATSYEVDVENGARYTFDVEVASPHRLLQWTGPDGEVGRLRGSKRLKYWELHDNGHEKVLESIGVR